MFGFAAAMVGALLVIGSWHFSGTTDERQQVVGVLVDGEWQWQHKDGRNYVHNDDDDVQATVSKEVMAMRSDSDWLVPLQNDAPSSHSSNEKLTTPSTMELDEDLDSPLSDELAGENIMYFQCFLL